jgi:serine/threonine protein kinase
MSTGREEVIQEAVFFPEAIKKLKERLSSDDLNFFDPTCDFTVEVSDIHLLDKLAEGSYGVVYKAAIGTDMYAVKVEDLRTGVEEQLNILSELTLLQSLPHECLVKYFGTGYLSKSSAEAKVWCIL